MKNYDSIDLMKFVASIFVVAIHSNPLLQISPISDRIVSSGIARLAVPLFFLASSFFLFKGGELTKEKLKKYLKRMGLLYVAWFIISLPITVFNRFGGSRPLSVKIFQFVKSFFVSSTFSGSWFLASCMFCTILFFFIGKLNNKTQYRVLIPLSVIIYLFCTFTSAYGKIMDSCGLRHFYDSFVFWFNKPYTSILVGIPYFTVGKFMAAKEVYIRRPPLTISALLVLLLIAEVMYTYKHALTNSTDCYLMLLPCAYCIFVSLLKTDIVLPNAKKMRNMSTIIFFSQFIWLFIIEFAEWFFKITVPNIFKFMVALGLCLLTYLLIIRIQSTNKFKLVKYLY